MTEGEHDGKILTVAHTEERRDSLTKLGVDKMLY